LADDMFVMKSVSSDEVFTFFWKSALSQWRKSPFQVHGVEYNCAEQYMMAQKAIIFGDMEKLSEIMEAKLPSVQKKLGRQVKNFDVDEWNDVASIS